MCVFIVLELCPVLGEGCRHDRVEASKQTHRTFVNTGSDINKLYRKCYRVSNEAWLRAGTMCQYVCVCFLCVCVCGGGHSNSSV